MKKRDKWRTCERIVCGWSRVKKERRKKRDRGRGFDEKYAFQFAYIIYFKCVLTKLRHI